MCKQKTLQILSFCLIAIGLPLSACQPGPPIEPTHTATAAFVETQAPVPTDNEVRAADTLVAAPRTEGTLVFHNGTVVTATGAEPVPDAAIVIENGLITAVGPEAEIEFPEEAAVIDVEGQTILPGLIDARASGLLNRLRITDGEIPAIDLKMHLSPFRGGVTTVRATGWDWEKQQGIAALRTSLGAHGNTLPTVVIAGTALAHGDGSALRQYPADHIGVVTVEETRQAAERLVELGVDQIYLTMSITQESGNEPHAGLPPTLSPEQLETIVQVAHNNGKWVVGQAVFPDEAEMLVAAGVDEIACWPSRAVPIPESLIQQLVTRSIPVVSGFNLLNPQDGDVRRFLDAGGMLVFGTYGPNSGPLSSPYREFMVMSRNGMTPMEIILSATANAAHAIGLGDVVGTLEAGKQADIIVVDGDPFEDLLAIAKVVYVVKGGELVLQPEVE